MPETSKFKTLTQGTQPFPLQLTEYHVTEVSVRAQSVTEQQEGTFWVNPGDPRLKIHTAVRAPDEGTSTWCCGLSVELNEEDIEDLPEEALALPYVIEISVLGWFEVSPTIPISNIEHLVNTSAPSLLFGIAREMIANITRGSLNAWVCLPTLTFYYPPPGAGDREDTKHAQSARRELASPKPPKKPRAPKKAVKKAAK